MLNIPSCKGNHVFIVDHGYPWLFHGHVFIFHTHGQECNHSATKTWLTIVTGHNHSNNMFSHGKSLILKKRIQW